MAKLIVEPGDMVRVYGKVRVRTIKGSTIIREETNYHNKVLKVYDAWEQLHGEDEGNMAIRLGDDKHVSVDILIQIKEYRSVGVLNFLELVGWRCAPLHIPKG